MARVLYGPILMDVAASGDLNRMKEVAAEAEAHLKGAGAQGGAHRSEEEGDLEGALAALKAEIAKMEAR